jgi:hypothetical protein
MPAFSSRTWDTAARLVASVVNGQEDPDDLQRAREFISDALKEWNKRTWNFLLTGPETLSLTTATKTYNLGASVKKPYCAYLVGADRWIGHVPREEYLAQLKQNTLVEQGLAYSLYNISANAVVEINPSTTDSLLVWYWRKMATTGTGHATLDILDDYDGYLLASAKAMMLADKGPNEKMQFWMQKAAEGYIAAIADDEITHVGEVRLSVPDSILSEEE